MLYPAASQKALIAKTVGNVELASGVGFPTLEDNEVLVKVEAVALNPVDWKTLAYSFTAGTISGCDFAGTVVSAAGPDCQRHLNHGTRVCGWIMGANPMRLSNGSFAEYLAAKADFLFLIPDSMSFETAAAIWDGSFNWGICSLQEPRTLLRGAPRDTVVALGFDLWRLNVFRNHGNPATEEGRLLHNRCLFSTQLQDGQIYGRYRSFRLSLADLRRGNPCIHPQQSLLCHGLYF